MNAPHLAPSVLDGDLDVAHPLDLTADQRALAELAARHPLTGDRVSADLLARDASAALLEWLRVAQWWTPVRTDAAGAVTLWVDEHVGNLRVPIDRTTLHRWALEDAADKHGIGIDALADLNASPTAA